MPMNGEQEDILPDRAAMTPAARVGELEAAIRKHRDARGDDRCWLDDLDLYAVLGDAVEPSNAEPPRDTFLANCQRFYDARCRDAAWPGYQELEQRVADLLQLVRDSGHEKGCLVEYQEDGGDDCDCIVSKAERIAGPRPA
jgi:hypothetical protein